MLLLLLAAALVPASSAALAGSEDSPRRRSGLGAFLRSSTASKYQSAVMRAFRTVIAQANRSTVVVLCDGRQAALGTVVDEAGYIVTKASELSGEPSVRLRTGGLLDVKVVGTDETNDLALLKVSGTPKPGQTGLGLRAVQWSPSDDPPLGSWIITPGIGADPESIGVVSVRQRPMSSPRYEKPKSGFLGISFSPTAQEALIESVIGGTAAAKAGLRSRDVITRAGRTEISDRQALLNFLSGCKPGDEVALHVKRGRREFDVTVKLGQWLSGRQLNPQEHMGGELSLRSDGFARIIQHDGYLEPRDCGGPALDSSGKAVGINIARAGRSESYVLPWSVLVPVIGRLKAEAARPAPTTKPALTTKPSAGQAGPATKPATPSGPRLPSTQPSRRRPPRRPAGKQADVLPL